MLVDMEGKEKERGSRGGGGVRMEWTEGGTRTRRRRRNKCGEKERTCGMY